MKKRISLFFVGALAASTACAEAPMSVDDAGTLGKGGMKIEGVWHRDDELRGGSLALGYGPVENLELGISYAHDRETSVDPDITLEGAAIGAKWVPWQNEVGWSLGASLSYERTRVEGEIEHASALVGLATYRFANQQVLHLNAGVTHVKVPGDGETLRTWGAGYEFPLAQGLQLTAEIFGEEQSGPDKAVGLRYEILDGLKLSAAIGRGNGRGFGQAGFAWEF